MSSYRRQWWGAEGKKQPKLTWDFFTVGNYCECVCRCGCSKHIPRSLTRSCDDQTPRVWSWTRGVGESSGNSRPFMLQPVLPTLMSRHGHSSFHHLSLSCFPASSALHSRVTVSTFIACVLQTSRKPEKVGGEEVVLMVLMECDSIPF